MSATSRTAISHSPRWRSRTQTRACRCCFIWACGPGSPASASRPHVAHALGSRHRVVGSRLGRRPVRRHPTSALYRLLLGAAAGISTGILFGFLVGLSTNARACRSSRSSMPCPASPASPGFRSPWHGSAIGLSMSTFVIWNGMFFVVFANTALGVSRVPASLRQSVLTLGGGTIGSAAQRHLPRRSP